MNDNIIEVIDVAKRWGSFTAFENLNLNIRRGEILTLLGPSGCGKSTLMRIIAGLEDATEGEVIIDGKQMTTTPPEKRPVNMVFQRYALFPHLDVFDNVAFGPRLKRKSKAEVKKEVERALELVELTEFKSRWINEISGGQAQRVALARALVNRPSVLLLDEPLAALDLKIRHQMLDELKRIHRETGTTFLFVTHDQDEAMILSDRVVLMNHGKIEQIGTPDEMYGKPKSLFCAKFFGETNLFDGRVKSSDSTGVNAETVIGDIQAANGDAGIGEKIHLSIRPESIRISQRKGGELGKNEIEGVVVGADFIGSRIVYKVRHQSNQILLCQAVRGPAGMQYSEGTPVSLKWDAHSIVTLAG